MGSSAHGASIAARYKSQANSPLVFFAGSNFRETVHAIGGLGWDLDRATALAHY